MEYKKLIAELRKWRSTEERWMDDVMLMEYCERKLLGLQKADDLTVNEKQWLTLLPHIQGFLT